MSLNNHQTFKYLLLGLFILPGFTSAQSLKYSTSLLQNKDWSFVENKGQIPSTGIQYYGHQGGINIYCKTGMISFVFTKIENEGREKVSEATGGDVSNVGVQNSEPLHWKLPALNHQSCSGSRITTNRADLILLNSNPAAEILASDQQEYYENYYTTGNADSGITHVHTFKKITYKGIYPYIDMVLACREKGLEYSFVVYPGGEVSDIQMQWEGIDKIEKLKDSKIEYSCALGKIDESKPVSYVRTTLAVARYPVSSAFTGKNNRIGFQVGDYDKSKVLVIDPTLEWGTYFNGSEFMSGILTDSFGNVYIDGSTTSASGVATNGSYQSSYSGNSDAFLTEFNSKGVRKWSSYFGSSKQDGAQGIAKDRYGNFYISGTTQSDSGMATNGSYQVSGGYNDNAFLAQFNANGILHWSTYFGGDGQDVAEATATDGLGYVYITGYSFSLTGLATIGAYKTSNTGNGDAFLAKFDSSGAIQWATYFGGYAGDAGSGITTDANENVYMTGTTASGYFITTNGAYQASYSGGDDAFITKFSSSGLLQWATYFGGSGEDGSYGIVSDPSGNIYIAGLTTSDSGIAKNCIYQSNRSGGYDCFIAKFNSNDSLLWASYYGGSSDDIAAAIAMDTSENIYITGFTKSNSRIAYGEAYRSNLVGNQDVFVAKFNDDGARQWGTYYGGGNSEDIGWGIATFGNNTVYIGGTTGSSSGIATTGAFQTSLNGMQNDFIAKFRDVYNDAGVKSILNPNKNLCQSTQNVAVQLKNFGNAELDSVEIYWSINGKLQNQYNWKGNLQTDSTTNVTIGNDSFPPGIDTIKAWTSQPNGFKDSIPENDTLLIIDTVYGIPLPIMISNTTICPGTEIVFGDSATPGHTYSWASKPPGFTSTLSNPVANPQDSVTEYYLTETNTIPGCSATDSTKITVAKVPKINAGGNHTICLEDSVTIGSLPLDSNANYFWQSFPYYLSFSGLFHKISPPGNIVCYLIGSYTPIGGIFCYVTDSAVIKVLPLPMANTGAGNLICSGLGVQIGGSDVNGDSYQWHSVPTGFTDTTSNPFVFPKTNTTYFLTETDLTGCAKTDSVTIAVNPSPKPNAGPLKIVCSGDTVTIGTNDTIPGYKYSWHSLQSNTYPLFPRIVVRPVISCWYILAAVDPVTGCIGKDSTLINALPLPQPKISGPNEVCANQFPNIYFVPSDSGSTYYWSIQRGKVISGQGSDSIDLEADTAFNNVYVKETDVKGCQNTDSMYIYANRQPNAHWFMVSDSPVLVFKAVDSIEQYYQWSFGDGSTGSGYTVSHKYSLDKDSNVDVSLTVSTGFGCSTTFDSTIKINYTPPRNFYIHVFPNPFNQNINIKISLEKPSHIQVMAYDDIGRLIGKLIDTEQPGGIVNYGFDTEKYNLAYGIYYLKILVDGKPYSLPIVRVE